MKYLLLAAAALCFTGCSSNGLVHDKNYVRAASVTSGSEVEVTFSFFSEDQPPLTVSAGDLDSALDAAQLSTGKTLFTGFTELLIINSDTPAELLEYMLDEWTVSPTCKVAYSSSGSELLMDSSAEKLRGSVEEAVRLGTAPDSDIVTVLKELLTDGSAELAALPDTTKTAVVFG